MEFGYSQNNCSLQDQSISLCCPTNPLPQLIPDSVDTHQSKCPGTVDNVSYISFPDFAPVFPNHHHSSQCAHSFSNFVNRESGVKCVSVGDGHTLLLTYSGEVYSWGCNDVGQVLFGGPRNITSPIKLPLSNIVTISAGYKNSFAVSVGGQLHYWGRYHDSNINVESSSNKWNESSLFLTLNSPYNIKELYAGRKLSFALTYEGQVVKWSECQPLELIEGISNVIFISVSDESFVAIDGNSDFFLFHRNRVVNNSVSVTKLPVTQHITPKKSSECSFLFDRGCLFVIDINGDVWQFACGPSTFLEPTKIEKLSHVICICGYEYYEYDSVYAALDLNGKVFVWGWLCKMSDFYENQREPRCIEAFTNIEGISVGDDFLLAYNKNTVWAWGRNDKGQLGTGDLIDRPQPVKVLGSEILGAFHYPKQPLDRMFSGLIKLVYWEFLGYLQKLFGNHSYVKARFYTKCGISKRVAQCAQEVFNDHPIQRNLLLKNPQDLDLNENICDLQLRLSTDYNGPKVINNRIKKLDLYYGKVRYNPQLLFLFPNVEVLTLGQRSIPQPIFSLDVAHLSNLHTLELNCPFVAQQLPTSLVKISLNHCHFWVNDLSYLTSLKELVVLSCDISDQILEGKLALPPSLISLAILSPVNIQVSFPRLKELVIRDLYNELNGATEQNFPCLKFIQLIKPEKHCLLGSPLAPTKFINHGLIKSIKLFKNEYLVELSCFPWFILYPTESYLVDIFCEYLDQNE
ncbi:hypothetical protein P9112_005965 [Eukaryota sp. TZLM1-RC]